MYMSEEAVWRVAWVPRWQLHYYVCEEENRSLSMHCNITISAGRVARRIVAEWMESIQQVVPAAQLQKFVDPRTHWAPAVLQASVVCPVCSWAMVTSLATQLASYRTKELVVLDSLQLLDSIARRQHIVRLQQRRLASCSVANSHPSTTSRTFTRIYWH